MKKTTLIIARHGNTFLKEQTPTRVGRRTDLPLVETEKGTRIGQYLKENNLIPTVVYSSPLFRTTQTALLAIKSMGIFENGILEIPMIISDKFSEIDYGVDENKTEEEVCLRIGKESLGKDNLSKEEYIEEGKRIIDIWNTKAIPPKGWIVNPEAIKNEWKNFGKEVAKKYEGQVVMVVTSHGIAKYAPYLTSDANACYEKFGTKLKTGGICIFEKDKNDNDAWECIAWGV